MQKAHSSVLDFHRSILYFNSSVLFTVHFYIFGFYILDFDTIHDRGVRGSASAKGARNSRGIRGSFEI